MPITDAKGMHADLTDLLLELKTLREQAHATQQDQIIQVTVNGGKFK
jgi:hypothetical protein